MALPVEEEVRLEAEQSGEEVILNFREMSRCRVCFRLVPLRRLLRDGCCKCGSRAVTRAAILKETDIGEIEEEYGWDRVTISGIAPGQIEAGLLPARYGASRDPGSLIPEPFDLSETRLHSRERDAANVSNDGKRRLIVPGRFALSIPRVLRNVRSWKDVLKGTR